MEDTLVIDTVDKLKIFADPLRQRLLHERVGVAPAIAHGVGVHRPEEDGIAPGRLEVRRNQESDVQGRLALSRVWIHSQRPSCRRSNLALYVNRLYLLGQYDR